MLNKQLYLQMESEPKGNALCFVVNLEPTTGDGHTFTYASRRHTESSPKTGICHLVAWKSRLVTTDLDLAPSVLMSLLWVSMMLYLLLIQGKSLCIKLSY